MADDTRTPENAANTPETATLAPQTATLAPQTATLAPQTATPALLHTELIPIRWGDMDAMQHLNNTVYFRFMEQARISWLDGMREQLAAEASGTVIVRTACNFRKPFTYPGTVEVRLLVNRVGGASITTLYQMRLQGEDTLFADGEAVIVWINLASGRAVRVPAAVRAAASSGAGLRIQRI